MIMRFLRVRTLPDRCHRCGFCTSVNICYSAGVGYCTGCLSCYWACPYEAKVIEEVEEERKLIRIEVDGVEVQVPEGITVLRALELLGYRVTVFPERGEKVVNAPCRTGSCWACAVVINGELERSCITPVREGMKVSTDVKGKEPLRVVHGPQPHPVGGKGTPWWEKRKGRYIEVAIWVGGCNLRCPQCQNYFVTYDNTSTPMTPKEAARLVTYYRRKYGVNGLAISGGEPTINRKWLVEYFRELRRLNPDKKARLHLDSNGTVLTPDYIDELVEAGCNNIGVEPKALYVDTYMRITGIADRELAEKYLQTAWNAVKYIIDHYRDRVYLGVGFVYNSALISREEIVKMGEKLASWDPEVQVCVLDYFPAFRRRDLVRPPPSEMLEIKKLLNDVGLKYVIVQTSIGHFGP